MSEFTGPASATRAAPQAAPEAANDVIADDDADMAEANRILSEAGWTVTVRPPWRGSHCLPGMVGGVSPDGTPYVKNFRAFPQADAVAHGLDPADYPDTYHEAAAWLVEHVKPRPMAAVDNPLSMASLEPAEAPAEGADMAAPSVNINVSPVFNVTGGNASNDAEARAIREAEALFGVSDETHGETNADTQHLADDQRLGGGNNPDEPTDQENPHASAADAVIEGEPAVRNSDQQTDAVDVLQSEAADDAPEAVADIVDSGADTVAEGDEGSAEERAAGGGLQVLHGDGQDGAGDSDVPVDYEADFEEVGDDSEELALIEAAEPPHNPPEYERAFEQPSGGVVYFGDDIHVARLAKMGRLLEIATERKALLQEGWTLAEFASLQNLIVRIDRGEAADDQEAKARFLAISERSAAMSGIDAYLGKREAELEIYAGMMRSEDTREDGRTLILAFNPEEGWPE
jgi:hypothetical protein